MPGRVFSPVSKLEIRELHPTFGAEIQGFDFSQPIPDDIFEEILGASAKISEDSHASVHGSQRLRLDDAQHVEFSRRFGELDDIRLYLTNGRKPRYEHYELFDAGNLDAETGKPLDPASDRAQYNKGNASFHVDLSFNPRRASYSILKTAELPPPETGGAADFADTRTAFGELPADLKQQLLNNDYVAAHSLHHSRKVAAPEFFKDSDPAQYKMHHHRLVQKHEPSGRMNLYVAAHAHHIEALPREESDALLKRLMDHATPGD